MNFSYSVSFTDRIYSVLPPWFGDNPVNLLTMLHAYDAGHTTVAVQIINLIPFTRIKTTTGELLDLAAYDFFGDNEQRNANELDDAYRTRWLSKLFQPTGTRPAFIAQITAASGNPPIIFDPRQPRDTGIIGSADGTVVPTLFYNVGFGGYTNFDLPYQWFVIISNTAGLYTDDALYAYICDIMPVGTVCWVYIGSLQQAPITGWDNHPGWDVVGWA